MKIQILNQVIEITNSKVFLPFPHYDINHSTNTIFVSAHINLSEDVDLGQLNTIILKGAIDLISFKYGSLNSKDDIILNWVGSKINLVKDVYVLKENKKYKPFK